MREGNRNHVLVLFLWALVHVHGPVHANRCLRLRGQTETTGPATCLAEPSIHACNATAAQNPLPPGESTSGHCSANVTNQYGVENPNVSPDLATCLGPDTTVSTTFELDSLWVGAIGYMEVVVARREYDTGLETLTLDVTDPVTTSADLNNVVLSGNCTLQTLVTGNFTVTGTQVTVSFLMSGSNETVLFVHPELGLVEPEHMPSKACTTQETYAELTVCLSSRALDPWVTLEPRDCRVGGVVNGTVFETGLVTSGDIVDTDTDTTLCELREDFDQSVTEPLLLERLEDVELRFEPTSELATMDQRRREDQDETLSTLLPVGGMVLQSYGGSTDGPDVVWQLGTLRKTAQSDTRFGHALGLGPDLGSDVPLFLGPARVEPFGTYLVSVVARSAGDSKAYLSIYRCHSLDCAVHEALFIAQEPLTEASGIGHTPVDVRVRYAGELALDQYRVAVAYAARNASACTLHYEQYHYNGTWASDESHSFTVTGGAVECDTLSNPAILFPRSFMDPDPVQGPGAQAFQVGLQTNDRFRVYCGNYEGGTCVSPAALDLSSFCGSQCTLARGRTLAVYAMGSSGNDSSLHHVWVMLSERTVKIRTCTDRGLDVCAEIDVSYRSTGDEASASLSTTKQATLVPWRLRSGHVAWSLVVQTAAATSELHQSRCGQRDCTSDIQQALSPVAARDHTLATRALQHVSGCASHSGQRLLLFGYDAGTDRVYSRALSDDHLWFESPTRPRVSTVWHTVLRRTLLEPATGHRQSLVSVYGPHHHPLLILLDDTDSRLYTYVCPNDACMLGGSHSML